MGRRSVDARRLLLPAVMAGLGCAPPPEVALGGGEPGIELLYPTSGVDVPLTRDGADLVLDLVLAVDLSGVVFVPPSEAAAPAPGEGRFRFSVDGSTVDEPESRYFTYRSAPGRFEPGDVVQLGVSLIDNAGEDLDGSPGWTDTVEFNVVAPVAPTAEVRFVHASADAGPLDVYEVGSAVPLARDLAFGEATSWVSLAAEPLRIELRERGDGPSSEPLFTDILDLVDGERVNAVAAGLVAGPGGGSLRVVPVVEGWGNDVPGRARVRFVHAVPDMGVVTLEGAGTGPVNVGPFKASDEQGETIDVDGGVRLGLRAQADEDAATSFTTPELVDGDDVLLIATGRLSAVPRASDGLRLLAIGPDGPLEPILQDPLLYVLHGSRDSEALELCARTQEIAANLTYGEMVAAQVAPGSYDLQIFNYPAGCTGNALNGLGNTTTFEAGERYLMLLTGEQTANAGEASIQAASFLDAFTLGDDVNAKVSFVHGASYSQVYVGVVDGGWISAQNVLTPPIAWRVASAEVSVGPGAVVLGIADAVGQPPPPYAPIVRFDYAARGGERQWGIVAGDPTPDDADDGGLQVLVVDTAPPVWTVARVDVR